MAARRARRAAVSVHLWLGLIVGALWALQGLTGALLVWQRDADRLLNPQYAAEASGAWQPLSRLAAAMPGAERLSVVDGRENTVAVTAGGRAAIVEAATGRVLGTRESKDPALSRDGFFRWVFELHHFLLAGDRGELVLGVSALLLASATGLGLWIALPLRGLFRRGGWRVLRQKLWGWHRLTGVLAAAALLPIALTGAYLIWKKEIRDWADARFEMSLPPTAKTALAGAPALDADTAWARARAQFPDAAFVSVQLPGAKAAEYRFRLRQPGEVRDLFGVTAVWVDARDGRIAYRYDALAAPLANRVFDSLFAIHTGEIAGSFGRWAVLAAGLSLPMLWVTGVWLWAAKRRARRGRRLEQEAGVPVLQPGE